MSQILDTAKYRLVLTIGLKIVRQRLTKAFNESEYTIVTRVQHLCHWPIKMLQFSGALIMGCTGTEQSQNKLVTKLFEPSQISR
jgi:hypothetical protein